MLTSDEDVTVQSGQVKKATAIPTHWRVPTELSGCVSGTGNKQGLSASKVTFKVAREKVYLYHGVQKVSRQSGERFPDFKENPVVMKC